MDVAETAQERAVILRRMQDPHIVNIAIHVACGVTAFFLGLGILSRPKGDVPHRFWGRVFAVLMSGVIVTAALGAFMFRPNPTLVTITFLVAYLLISGVRVARNAQPTAFDDLLAMAAFVGAGGFLAFLSTGAPAFWRPEVTMPIGGALAFYSGYDLLRRLAPGWRARYRTLEHGAKMIAAVGGLASAGLGTIFPQFQPWSQIAPSIVFSALAIGYVFAHVLWGQASAADRE